jgi:hypothetical protein
VLRTKFGIGLLEAEELTDPQGKPLTGLRTQSSAGLDLVDPELIDPEQLDLERLLWKPLPR